MFLFLLYKIGIFLANSLPLKISVYAAIYTADVYSFFSREDFESAKENLRVILSSRDEKKLDCYAREVFRNFALYILEFFRAKSLNDKFIKQNVRITGLEHFQDELKRSSGIIGLTAHIGNWELLGIVMSRLGFRLNSVALTHDNRLVNEIFLGHRRSAGANVIGLGNIKGCISALKRNEILALVGDKDFSNNSTTVKFFGRDAEFPKGPAMLSLRTGARILPGFLLREKGGFNMILHGPVQFERKGIFEEDVVELTRSYALAIENIVRQYPTQWIMFKRFYKD